LPDRYNLLDCDRTEAGITMLRAHKIRLNPTPAQQAYFRKAAGTARFVYNWGLAEVKCALDGKCSDLG